MVKYSFAVAAHSYFRILNKEYARRTFLGSQISEPIFAYTAILSPELIFQRINKVGADTVRKALDVAYAGSLLQRDASVTNVELFRQANESLYGSPSVQYIIPIMNRLKAKVNEYNKAEYDYISRHVTLSPADDSVRMPSDDTFVRYKEYMQRYVQLPDDQAMTVADRMNWALDRTGLQSAGWRVVERSDASHAHVIQKQKRIYIGREYKPRSKKSAERIVVHEIYGHAVRGPQQTISESEGFAALLEQLVEDKFALTRSVRYLAAALGWGTLGQPKSFRETYEIIWRVMVVSGRYSRKDAQCHAFDECSRVFRGGLNDARGAVFLKDSLYFKANMDMWMVLETAPLDYNEFVEVIEGRRKLL